VTELLLAWGSGDRSALDQLVPIVHEELRRLARLQMRAERDNHTLQTTALVNEVYLKFTAQQKMDWQGRAHFFGIAARLMRRILVDHARHVGRAKRGGQALHVALDDADPSATPSPVDALDVFELGEALSRLEALDPQQGRVVELRYFGGMTIEETAGALRVSIDTVKRDWQVARMWLLRALEQDT
jgi:RNA polymerase sigma factor (TIGR02999 family)